jgi:hypothetical protein
MLNLVGHSVYRLIISSDFREMSWGRIWVFYSKLCLIYIRNKLNIGAKWEEVSGQELEL